MSEQISFKIIRKLGTLSTNPMGWSKEANIVSWNEGTPKIDIREWDPTHERMTRGITLFEDEAKNLAKILSSTL